MGNDWQTMMGQMGSAGHWHWYGPVLWALLLVVFVILLLRRRGQ